MSDQVEDKEAVAGEAKKPGKRKTLIIGGAGAALLLLGGGAYAMMGGSSEPTEAEADAGESGGHGAAEGEGGEGKTYVEVPPMVVNLRSADGQPRFLKLRFMFVPGAGHTEEEVTKKVPFILDAYQPLLRELRPEDLSGSAAVFRLKEEMLVRAIEAGGEGLVADVLIQDLIQQ